MTICVPTIGRVEYLPHTRRSLVAQSFTDLEILVLDNASPTPAEEMLAQWAAADPRVQLLRISPRIPMFENFNRGIRAARGEYLAFCHDDDELAKDYVARCVSFMDAHPSVAFCAPNYSVIDSTGAVLERRSAVRRDAVWDGLRYLLRILATGRNPLTMQAMFYRRSAMPEEGLDSTLSPHFGDFVFLMRMAERASVGALAADLVRVRKHIAQASGTMPMSEQVSLRTGLLASYCDEFARRHPNQNRLVSRMRAANDFSRRTSLLWGWVTATNDAEASLCIDGLSDDFADRVLRSALRGMSNLGMRPRPPSSLLKRVRDIAARLGL